MWGSLNRRIGSRVGFRHVRQGTVLAFVLLCLIGLLGLRALDPQPVEALRLRTFDLFQMISPRDPIAQSVIIVNIDERSLDRLGQWPWPRTVIADLVDKISSLGAKAIAFDFLLAEPDRLSPSLVSDYFRDLPPEAKQILKAMPSNDSLLAQAIRRHRTVLGQAAVDEILPPRRRAKSGVAPAEETLDRLDRAKSASNGSAVVALTGPPTKFPRPPFGNIGPDPRPYLLSYPSMVRNLPELEEAASGWGMFSLGPESDNIVRRVPAVLKVGREVYPSLAIELLRVAGRRQAYAIRADDAGISSVIVDKYSVPTDSRGRIWVHFAPRTPTRYLSASDIVDGKVDADRIRDRMVLIGSSVTGLRDLRATPVARSMPGVEIHAQLLETIISGNFLERPNFALGMELFVLLVTGLLIVFMVPRLGAWWTLALGGIVAIALFGGSWLLYSEEGLLVDAAYPALAAFALYSILVVLSYMREESARRQIRSAFTQYTSPELVARLSDDPSQLKLGGERREMTLLFSDVQGFTTLSEHYDAVSLTNLVNRVLNPLTMAVLDTHGTVDKYMGDSIMAFWNAPLADPNHAKNACLAALAMGRALAPLNDQLRDEARAARRPYHPINIGIGVNTGECCVGNMGSDLRFDYSVLGDTVNIAARLEGQTRAYKTRNIIGESTYRLAPELAFLEIDLVEVVGKTVPVRIYTLLGDETVAMDDDFKELKQSHDIFLSHYRAQAWDLASEALDACHDQGTGFGLSAMYDVFAARIGELAITPPGTDWNAVYVAVSKH